MILITLIVLLLYLRTWNYQYLIDDICDRHHYLTTMTSEIDNDKSFYDKKRTPMYCITNIATLLFTSLCIHLIWGFYPALLFAVFPLNVSSTSWKIGNMYLTSVFLCLVSYYFMLNYGLFGILLSIPFYIGALHSSVNCFAFPFVTYLLTFNPLSFLYVIPLVAFLTSPRFLNGLKKRVNLHENMRVDEAGKFNIKRLFIMVKVLTYYIYVSVIPRHLGFFTNWGLYAHNIKRDTIYYLSLILNIVFFIWGWQIDPKMIIWWYGYMAIFSQYAIYGMFTAERYTYFGNVAFCVLISKALAPYPFIFAILATIYFCRSWMYVKAFRSNRALFQASIEAFPDTPENYNNLGTDWLRKRAFHRALECFMIAYRLSKWRSGNLLHNLAMASYKTANYQKGLAYIQEGLSKDKFPKDRMDKIFELRNNCLNGIHYLNRKRKGLTK